MKTLLIALCLLFLAVLPQLSHADFAGYTTEQGNYFQDRLNGWTGIAISAIFVCVLFNALLYMAGMGLESEHLKQYARSEFLQVTASSMMIFFAVALLYNLSGSSAFDLIGNVLGTGRSTIDCAAVSGGKFGIWDANPPFGAGPIGAFKCKVQEKIDALDRAYNNVVASNRGVEKAASFCLSFFGVPVYCGDWDQTLHNEVESAHLVATKITSLLISLHAQYSLAEYVQKNMLTVFLPFGLLLRILPISRGVGGLFIAIAVGLFFVWPTFFVLTDPTFVKQDAQAQDLQQGVCFTGFKGSTTILAAALFGGGRTDTLSTASGADLVFQITIATLFYPFVSLALTLMFIRATAPLLGGDLGELMKMVSRLG